MKQDGQILQIDGVKPMVLNGRCWKETVVGLRKAHVDEGQGEERNVRTQTEVNVFRPDSSI